MARLARVVVPGLRYHVTQRGNGRPRVFFADPDYAAYRDWLADARRSAGGRLGMVSDAEPRPSDPRPARRRRPAPRPGARASSIRRIDPRAAAANRPFLAGTIRRRGDGRGPSRRRLPQREPQSRARPSRRAGRRLAVVERARSSGHRRGWPYRPRARRQRFSRFADLLEADEDEGATARLTQGESVGRPVGSDTFLAALETRTRRRLHALKRGPKPKDDGATAAAK